MTSVSEAGTLPARSWITAVSCCLAGNAIGIAVCLDDPLVDAPGRLHCGVLVCGDTLLRRPHWRSVRRSAPVRRTRRIP